MTDCLNCGEHIMFGYLSQEEFCSEQCFREFRMKHPDFDKRGFPNRCYFCGSELIIFDKSKEEKSIFLTGNVRTEETLDYWKSVFE